MAPEITQTNARICTEKKRLTDEFIQAVQEVIHLQSQESPPAVGHRTDDDAALKRARDKQDAARSAYYLHIQEHGC